MGCLKPRMPERNAAGLGSSSSCGGCACCSCTCACCCGLAQPGLATCFTRLGGGSAAANGEAAAAPPRPHVTLAVGFPEAAQRLGLASSNTSAEAHAASAVDQLTAGLEALGVAGDDAATAADEAATAGRGSPDPAQQARAMEYLRYRWAGRVRPTRVPHE